MYKFKYERMPICQELIDIDAQHVGFLGFTVETHKALFVLVDKETMTLKRVTEFGNGETCVWVSGISVSD